MVMLEPWNSVGDLPTPRETWIFWMASVQDCFDICLKGVLIT